MAKTSQNPRNSAPTAPVAAGQDGHDADNPFVDTVTMEKIVGLCKRRGFIFQSSEIYGGLASTYDYGHYGVLLKQNVKNEWQRAMVAERDDIVLLDSAIILHPKVWVASGHLTGFSDPLVDCRTCKLRFRADHLESASCGRKPSKQAGETDDCDLTEARQFNLMFETSIGPVKDEGSAAYLRPETAQGIFVNFKNVTSSMRVKPPFGIAQIGKSFRNEITPGNFLFRMREFEQMEMEYFVPPALAEEQYRYWIDERRRWYLELGMRESHLRVRAHEPDELSHYSSGTSDLEYLFPIGWSELEGIANRGDFDLRQHAEHSGAKLEWIGQDERYVPHVIEPAAGADRAALAFLVDAYDEEVVADRPRTVLRLHPRLAPVKVAVLPLIGNDSAMVEKARGMYEELRRALPTEYDDSAAIGKRYRRQDEIGTPWALTFDHELGDSLAFVHAQENWARDPSWLGPVAGIHAALAAVPDSIEGLTSLPGRLGTPGDPASVFEMLAPQNAQHGLWNLVDLLALTAAVVLTVVVYRRLGLPFALFSAASLAIATSAPGETLPLHSMVRFVMVDFPVLIVGATLLAGRPQLRTGVLVTLGAVTAVAGVAFGRAIWIA